MYVYNSLRNLANVFSWLRGEFYNWGNTIKGVWLIGQHLAEWLFLISGLMGQAYDAIEEVANDFLDLYNWLVHNLGSHNVPADLLRYADDLISFIRNPFEWIADSIRDHFPELYKIAQDPIEWVLETIYKYTGFDIEFVDNPRRVIEGIIHRIAGDIIDIARNPFGWVHDILDNIIPDFGKFVYDARGWVIEKIEQEYPFVISFLRDPDGFIEDKLVQFFERFADDYKDKAVKITETILNRIF